MIDFNPHARVVSYTMRSAATDFPKPVSPQNAVWKWRSRLRRSGTAVSRSVSGEIWCPRTASPGMLTWKAMGGVFSCIVIALDCSNTDGAQ